MNIAFFDFDGTITKKDSFLEFVSFTKGRSKMLQGVLLHLRSIIGYKLGFISGHRIKECLLKYFFKDISEEEFIKLGEQYAKEKLPSNLRSSALERIEWHKKQNHEIVVVTASIEHWVKPWCESLNIKCIATQIEIENHSLTGRLKGLNCIGPEKVNRISQLYNVSDYEQIYAYGNSKGDKELLEIATEKFYKVF